MGGVTGHQGQQQRERKRPCHLRRRRRRLTTIRIVPTPTALVGSPLPRGLHLSTFQLNLSHFWHKIRHKHPLMPPNAS